MVAPLVDKSTSHSETGAVADRHYCGLLALVVHTSLAVVDNPALETLRVGQWRTPKAPWDVAIEVEHESALEVEVQYAVGVSAQGLQLQQLRSLRCGLRCASDC